MVIAHCKHITLVGALVASVSMFARAEEPAKAVEAPAAAEAPKKVGLTISMKSLDTKDEAHRYAGLWLQAAGLGGLRVGKMQAIGGIYIADLMDAANPKQTVNQLMLRKKDGYTVLIYPTGPAKPARAKDEPAAAPAENKEAAVGMAGMEGMAGISGSKAVYGNAGGGAANSPALAPSDFLINSTQEANTAAKLWLYQNGLHGMKVGAIKEQGGIYVGKVLDKATGAQRNQFILRRADGLIAMVNPVALTPAKGTPPAHGPAPK